MEKDPIDNVRIFKKTFKIRTKTIRDIPFIERYIIMHHLAMDTPCVIIKRMYSFPAIVDYPANIMQFYRKYKGRFYYHSETAIRIEHIERAAEFFGEELYKARTKFEEENG